MNTFLRAVLASLIILTLAPCLVLLSNVLMFIGGEPPFLTAVRGLVAVALAVVMFGITMFAGWLIDDYTTWEQEQGEKDG